MWPFKHRYKYDYKRLKKWIDVYEGKEYGFISHDVFTASSEFVDRVTIAAPLTHWDEENGFPYLGDKGCLMFITNDFSRYHIRRDLEHHYEIEVYKYKYYPKDNSTLAQTVDTINNVGADNAAINVDTSSSEKFHNPNIGAEEIFKELEQIGLRRGQLNDRQLQQLFDILQKNAHLRQYKLLYNGMYGWDDIDKLYEKLDKEN